MVDIQLFESLIKALRLGSKLILVGTQISSLGGAGNVLKDLIDSDVIAVVHLSEVFRQAAESLIVTNAHAIVSGELPDLSHKDNDFFFLPQPFLTGRWPQCCPCAASVSPAYGCSPMWDIQVISPAGWAPWDCGTEPPAPAGEIRPPRKRPSLSSVPPSSGRGQGDADPQQL